MERLQLYYTWQAFFDHKATIRSVVNKPFVQYTVIKITNNISCLLCQFFNLQISVCKVIRYFLLQESYNDIVIKYDQLQKQYTETSAKLMELSQPKESDCEHNEISMSKLNADITSDKVAAQRATEQNKKLKQDMQNLEDAFVKMVRLM